VRTTYGESILRSTKRGKPKQIEERRGKPYLVETIEKEPVFIEERIVGVTTKNSKNLENLVVENMQRIMLLAMENKRLHISNQKLTSENGVLLNQVENLKIKISSISTFEEEIHVLRQERNQYFSYYE
jgi:hypothetical protein